MATSRKKSARAVLKPNKPAHAVAEDLSTSTQEVVEAASYTPIANEPYDNDLFNRARSQWQLGEWEHLAKLDIRAIEQHPDRAKLAILIAAAWQQLNDQMAVRRYIDLAQKWGCDKKLIASLLICGVYNSLGRAAELVGKKEQSLEYFRIAVSAASGSAILSSHIRATNELNRLGLNNKSVTGAAPALSQPANEIQSRAKQVPIGISNLELEGLVRQCVASEDLHDYVDRMLASQSLSKNEIFRFLCALSEHFHAQKDNVTALHFLATSRDFIKDDDEEVLLLSRKFMTLGRNDEAMELMLLHSAHNTGLSPKERTGLLNAYEKSQAANRAKSEHGHDLLLAHLKTQFNTSAEHYKHRPAVLIEIGTTRENVPGQGSTRKVAEFCKAANIHFITVDMDPHNTHVADKLFKELGVKFSAVNAKGEDYLRSYAGAMDFVFLDAYDFDHGKHSELRQSRYRKFLGHAIDEQQCHLMHLDCAKTVKEKLSPDGLVCVDDTWIENGKWTAKGTLAMPYLLEHGFELIEARNRAALLRRKKQGN